MKKYILSSEWAQKTVNLREYTDTIADAVLGIIDDDDTTVVVSEKYYYILADRRSTKEEDAAIEAILCNSELARYCTPDGVLFVPIEMTKKEEALIIEGED